MLKAVEDISTTRKRLKIEIPADALESEIKGSLEEVKKTTTLPGFRTGKAPMTLIEKRFGKKVEGEVLDRVIPKVYVDALKEADITPVTDPVLEEGIDFKRNQPLTMTFTVDVMPKIGDLAYEKMSVKDIPVSVDNGDIDGVLKRSQDEKATYDPSEGPIDMNDLLSLDYATLDGEVDVKDQIYKVGGSLFPEDFFQKLLGNKKGDTLTIETTFPDDHLSEKLAGKHVTLEVVINDVKKVRLPDMDDEFAKDMGFDNLGALKDHVREEILKAKKNEVAKIQKAEIIRKLLEAHEFDVPESLLESELDLLASSRHMKKEQESDDDEEIKEKLRPDALRNVRGSLLLAAIGKKEKVSVSDEDLKSAILSMSRRFGVPPESLMKFYISRDGSLEGLKNSLFEDKVLDLILSKAALEKGE
ncbi:MAG TPA: trigger factor [Thermodesulfovibrionales bacterium]|nr:trigger factor [Thermodesulfovibrionales bacterium]